MAKYEPSHLKTMNTGIVYREFKDHCNEGLFINEISKKSNISVPTVMKIVDFLQQQEIIVPIEIKGRAQVGRKPNFYILNKEKYYSIGIIFEGEYITLGIVNLAGQVVNFIETVSGKNIEESLIYNIDRLMRTSGRKKENLIGIGIGMPGIINHDTQQIYAPLIGIEEPSDYSELVNRISERYSANVTIDNDLNMDAFGEYNARFFHDKEDLIYISLGTGLGAGVIIDGKVREGCQNICGEIGYMQFGASDEMDAKAKSGWLENRINIHTLEKKFRLKENDKDLPERKTQAIEYTADYLALMMNILIVSFDISHIVLDGLAISERLGEELIGVTQKKLNHICFRPVTIERSETELPGISGAAIRAGNQWLDDLFESSKKDL